MRENMRPELLAERDRLAGRAPIDADDPYLGSTGAFVDRALARWREVAP
jgi:hypothetical protein